MADTLQTILAMAMVMFATTWLAWRFTRRSHARACSGCQQGGLALGTDARARGVRARALQILREP